MLSDVQQMLLLGPLQGEVLYVDIQSCSLLLLVVIMKATEE